MSVNFHPIKNKTVSYYVLWFQYEEERNLQGNSTLKFLIISKFPITFRPIQSCVKLFNQLRNIFAAVCQSHVIQYESRRF